MTLLSSFSRNRLRLVVAAGLFALVGAGLSTPAHAYPEPNGPGTANQPATFLPAPNPLPYCDGTDYFGYIDKNKALTDAAGLVDIEPTIDQNLNGNFTDDTGDQRIATAKAYTQDSGGTTLTFTSTNYVADSPKIYVTTNAPIGITMSEEGSAGTVVLSEPLFYSQWVFTDVDLNSEGFEVQPSWSGTTGEAVAFGGNTSFSFTGTTASKVDFNDTDALGGDGYELATRVQVDLLGAVDGLAITKTGAGGAGFMVGGGCPAIGASSSISTPVWDPVSGTFTATHTIKVANNLPSAASLSAAVSNAESGAATSFRTGDPSPIALSALQVSNAIDDTGFSSVSVSNLSATGSLVVDPAYDGVATTGLLTGASSLAAEGVETITFDVTYTPDPATLTCSAQRQAQGLVEAEAGGTPVADETDDGLDPSPIAVNEVGSGTDDPSSITFDSGCSLALTKTATSPVEVSPGVHEVTHRLTVTNDGERTVTDVQLSDALADDFAAATDFQVLDTTAVAGSCTLAAAGAYTGMAGADALLSGTDSLARGESCAVDVAIRFTAGAATGPFGGPAEGEAQVATDVLSASDSVAYSVTSTGGLSGMVSVDLDGDQAADQAAVGATVSVADGGGVLATDTTDGTGGYAFTGLAGGDYTVTVQRPADHRFVLDPDGGADGSAVVTVPVGSVTGGVDFLVEPFAATDDLLLGHPQGSTATVDVAANDAAATAGIDRFLLAPGDGSPVTSFTVTGEGTWTVTGATVSFAPLPTFYGDPSPVTYRVGADPDGPTATVTFGYTPTTLDAERTGVTAGTAVTVHPLDGARGDIDPDTLRLVDPVSGEPVLTVTVANVAGSLVAGGGSTGSLTDPGFTGTGTWTVDPTVGTITFTPGADFDGDPPVITYEVRSLLGETVTNVIIIEYLAPVAADVSDDNQPGQPVTVYPLANDGGQVDVSSLVLVDPVTGQEVKTITVAGEGTWTVSGDGGITFTPLPGFTGDPTPVTYRVTANNGSVAESTVSVRYAAATTPPDGGQPDGGQPGGGDGTGAGGADGTGALPATGADTTTLVGIGGLLVLLGLLTLTLNRARLLLVPRAAASAGDD